MAATLLISLAIYWLTNYFVNETETNAAYALAVYAVPVLSGGLAAFQLARSKTLRLPTAARNPLLRLWSAAERLARRSLPQPPSGDVQ